MISSHRILQRSVLGRDSFQPQFVGAFDCFKTLWTSSGPSTDKMSIDFPKEEEEVLRRWREIKAFETQVELSKSRPLYTFYDGPPFAT
jgi:hypothetical protein